MHDLDPLKHGLTTRGQLVRALINALGPAASTTVSVADFEAIANAFSVVTADGADLVNYAALLSVVDRAFVRDGLHADADVDIDASFARSIVIAPNPRCFRPKLDNAMRAALDAALVDLRVSINRSRLGLCVRSSSTILCHPRSRLPICAISRQIVSLRTVDLAPSFRAFDHVGSGFISEVRLWCCLDRVAVVGVAALIPSHSPFSPVHHFNAAALLTRTCCTRHRAHTRRSTQCTDRIL